MLKIFLLLTLCCIVLAGKQDLTYVWGKTAFRKCRKVMKERKESLYRCEILQEAFEEAIDYQASQMAAAMQISQSTVMKRTQEPFYRMHGEQLIANTIQWMLRKNVQSEEKVSMRLKNKLSGWMLKVGANDKNFNMQPDDDDSEDL